MIPLVTAAQMRALDAQTIELGLPAFTLMETAGRGVAERVLAACAPRPRAVAVVCGGGGNGGDGFVAARVLRDRGVPAKAYLAAPLDEASPAGQHRRLFERAGGEVIELQREAQLAARAEELRAAPLVLDALLGVGLSRPVTGHLAAVIELMNQAPRRWSIDVPSGLDADRGTPLGACVRAHATVSLGLHKLGVWTSPGFVYAGALHLVDLGIPRALVEQAALRAAVFDKKDARARAPVSDPLEHKGTRGHVLVVGGRVGLRGAGELAASAAMRVGAGRCTWAAPGTAAPVSAEASVMTRGLRDVGELARALEGKAAVCVGPGLGRDAVAAALLECVLDPGGARPAPASAEPVVLDAATLRPPEAGEASQASAGASAEAQAGGVGAEAQARGAGEAQAGGVGEAQAGGAGAETAPACAVSGGSERSAARPAATSGDAALPHGALPDGGDASTSRRPAVVLDADALFALAELDATLPPSAVVTPHPAEAARLLGVTTAEVEADRLTAARALVAKLRCVVVLKGARTLVSDGERDWLCACGSAALATAGSGDVLAGAIAGLCAQGLAPLDAALLAVWIHGRAGRELERELGTRGVLSSELPRQLARELVRLR
ncbi:MAG: NAD(P)H-hydrate epimerase [Kofleriaceae bacterium]